jgi:hypothetical protein
MTSIIRPKGEPFRIAALAGALAFLVAVCFAPLSQTQYPIARALETKEPVAYFISDGSGRTGYRSSDQELARWALQAWQRSVGKNLQFQPSTESNAIIRLYWIETGEGQYGEMRPLSLGRRRGAALFIQPDVESLGPDVARNAVSDPLLRDSIVYLTCLHEIGHALGLAHTKDFRDIMYYFGYGGDVVEFFGRYRAQLQSRNDIAKVSGLSDDDVKRIKALYGSN